MIGGRWLPIPGHHLIQSLMMLSHCGARYTRGERCDAIYPLAFICAKLLDAPEDLR